MSPFGHQGHEVDLASDNDSAISGFSDVSSTTSASSSKYDSVDEADGRKYHRYRQGKYMLPNDQSEQERLNLQHHLWLMTLDYNLSLAPLTKEPEHVLDFGTGTGAWAVDYAIEHPTAAVLGTDLRYFALPYCMWSEMQRGNIMIVMLFVDIAVLILLLKLLTAMCRFLLTAMEPDSAGIYPNQLCLRGG